MNTIVTTTTAEALRSLKLSLATAILDLQERAEQARRAGHEDERSALVAQSNFLSRKALAIRRAEIAASAATTLTPALAELSGLADAAQAAVDDIQSVADAIKAAGSLIALLDRLLRLFP